MASESTSSQQSQQLIPSSKVEEETKTITFLLSWWDKPLSFTQDEFVSAIGLPICKDVVPLPPKETIDIRGIIFSDLVNKLQNGKKNWELNICYTSCSFQKPLAYEVPLTSRMLKVAKFSEEPEQSLLPPFGEVNADDTADKSLYRASVQPVLDQNIKKDVEFVAMEEVAEEQSLEIPMVEQLLDEADKLNKSVQETPESPYDIESEIKVVKSFTSHISKLKDQTMHDSEEIVDFHEGSDIINTINLCYSLNDSY
ncbi:hypothetical protein Tco_0855915 [Tanacetum coccineum]